LLASETAVARARAGQIAILRDLDLRQVATADGCRSMIEWVASVSMFPIPSQVNCYS
jgi:hypothetical protein